VATLYHDGVLPTDQEPTPGPLLEHEQKLEQALHQSGGGSAVDLFHRIAFNTAAKMGSPWAFLLAVLVILAWASTGPLFHFGDTWQLVINTSTTIITFLMVFLIQSSQNRDARAVHLKLDELIRTSRARNAFADLENATDRELDTFAEEFRQLRKQGIDAPVAALRARKHAHSRHGARKHR
jgi:low affinity Fe/Cu permease